MGKMIGIMSEVCCVVWKRREQNHTKRIQESIDGLGISIWTSEHWQHNVAVSFRTTSTTF